ncbi:MAG: endopeptidase La [Alcanivoracaceae bacterium]|uniref:endopeptidase La n=1 Tax=Alcanivorax sp. MD8A TaxID=1177157 RepID=UPI000C598202|nr:endopeptidase La [Alcanivorax sp. MD8A]MAX54295.1 endopeptidase La [Alcanivoracaceae bacterium]PNE03444.1 ATP-dependent protease La [Alcanivorax sp. MD8A]
MLKDIPLLPLRDVVVYPHMVIPLFVGREKSIAALEAAMAADKQIMLVAQRNASDDDPGVDDIYRVGTVSTILQLLKLPDGTVKVLVEGGQRAHVVKAEFGEQGAIADVRELEEGLPDSGEQDALAKSLQSQFEDYVKLSKKVAPEVTGSVSSIDEVSRLADTIAAHLQLKLEEKQDVLEMVDVRERVEHLIALMESDIDVLKVEKRIRGRVKKQMEKSQREYYLNEQMKAIQKELGDLDETGNDLDELEKKLDSVGMPKEARDKAQSEFNKLKMMSPMSAEATVVRGYLDWMTSVPWKKRSRVKHDLANSKQVLDSDHYGLEEVKDRILEFLAVQSRVGKVKGPVLCLVGPPGVGKTSLGQSIAKATNRKFVRMALGGVRDEAEIRGHRRTYIGSMPGKIIQKLSKVGVRNPLFLLDEVDKMGMDNRGDPASALLEVLDPEQNDTFSDHYLEVDYNLSETLFICTSNSMNIPGPLLDRMEVIRIPGYTEDEKVNIALQYLVPKQIKNNGLKKDELVIGDDVVRYVVRHYTREAGVRGLEREISKICRKVVKENLLAGDAAASVALSEDQVEHYLGVRKFSFGRAEENDQVGQVTGLAWTSVGGELLTIESVSTPGKGRVISTGSLGDVMQESIQAAWTVVKSRAGTLGIRRRALERNDLHMHVPEGATPKDGPSAGIGMCTAMVSVLTGIPVRADVAMTGEITLRGQVLPIGGLKEKLLAAHRGGIKTVLIPEENERDLKEIPENIKASLDIRPVKWIDQVLDVALTHQPSPLSQAEQEEDLALAEEKNQEGNKRPSTH